MSTNPTLEKYIQTSTLLNADEISLVELYLETLDDKDRIVLNIALDELKSSFDLIKSSGFLNWKKEHLSEK